VSRKVEKREEKQGNSFKSTRSIWMTLICAGLHSRKSRHGQRSLLNQQMLFLGEYSTKNRYLNADDLRQRIYDNWIVYSLHESHFIWKTIKKRYARKKSYARVIALFISESRDDRSIKQLCANLDGLHFDSSVPQRGAPHGANRELYGKCIAPLD